MGALALSHTRLLRSATVRKMDKEKVGNELTFSKHLFLSLPTANNDSLSQSRISNSTSVPNATKNLLFRTMRVTKAGFLAASLEFFFVSQCKELWRQY